MILFALLSLTLPVAHAEITTAYPEVTTVFSSVSFDGKSPNPGRCSGTFISPRLLLTASHCVRHFTGIEMNGVFVRASDMSGRLAPDETAGPDDVYILRGKWWGTQDIHPTHVYVSPDAVPIDRPDLSLDFVDQDLAILEFAYPLAPATRPVATRPSAPGDAVTMVGFGRHASMEPGGAGFGGILPIRHYGNNVIAMAELDSYVIKGSSDTCYSPDGHLNDWTTCPGDSGGALIDQATGAVIGVTSSSATFKSDSPEGLAHHRLSIFTDVTSQRAAAFIESVVREADTHPIVMPPARSGS